jgi:hypothetical protein
MLLGITLEVKVGSPNEILAKKRDIQAKKSVFG